MLCVYDPSHIKRRVTCWCTRSEGNVSERDRWALQTWMTTWQRTQTLGHAGIFIYQLERRRPTRANVPIVPVDGAQVTLGSNKKQPVLLPLTIQVRRILNCSWLWQWNLLWSSVGWKINVADMTRILHICRRSSTIIRCRHDVGQQTRKQADGPFWDGCTQTNKRTDGHTHTHTHGQDANMHTNFSMTFLYPSCRLFMPKQQTYSTRFIFVWIISLPRLLCPYTHIEGERERDLGTRLVR